MHRSAWCRYHRCCQACRFAFDIRGELAVIFHLIDNWNIDVFIVLEVLSFCIVRQRLLEAELGHECWSRCSWRQIQAKVVLIAALKWVNDAAGLGSRHKAQMLMAPKAGGWILKRRRDNLILVTLDPVHDLSEWIAIFINLLSVQGSIIV